MWQDILSLGQGCLARPGPPMTAQSQQTRHIQTFRYLKDIEEIILNQTKIFHPNIAKQYKTQHLKDEECDDETLLFLGEFVCLCLQ